MNFDGKIYLNVISTKNVTKINGEKMSLKNLLRASQKIKRSSDTDINVFAKKVKLY